MKKLLGIALLLLFPSVAFCGVTIKGVQLSGVSVSGGTTSQQPASYYTPASIEIREGGDAGGSHYKVAIFERTGNYTGTFVCESSTFDRHADMGTQSGTFTTTEVLTAGTYYFMVVLCDGYIKFGASGTASDNAYDAATYPSFDSSLSEENYVYSIPIEFVVKNSNGDTLLSWGNMTATDARQIPAGQQSYYQAGHQCATL